MSRPVTRRLGDSSAAGSWSVFARRPGYPILDITWLRGAPTGIGEFSFADPGGPNAIELTFPNVTIFDRLGYGDLAFMTKHTSVDIVWNGALPAAYPFGEYVGAGAARAWLPGFAWEGFFDAPTYGKDGVSWAGKGQMLQLDNYLAKPEYLARPISYEWAIGRCFLDRPHLRMPPPTMYYPSWWTMLYTPPPKSTPHYLVPAGPRAGKPWTGMLTRDTGSWEPTFSAYITKLLQGLYTQRGRFTFELALGRIPLLVHRDLKHAPDAETFVLDPVDDGVDVDGLSVDWSQTYDVAFAAGTSLTGVGYSGMQVSSDGQRTSYEPAAYRREAYPVTDNEWLDVSSMPRETMLQMPAGLDERSAGDVARSTMARFANPGVVGDVVLATDVHLYGDATPIPAALVRAGATVHFPGLFGLPDGVTAHVVANRVNLAAGTNTLTVDSQYRDALTVSEVKLRGRDAMNVQRMLTAGTYTPPLPDQLYPWDYAAGSGMIPGGKFNNSRDLFDAMPESVRFPWTDWTTSHPPSKSRWRHCYAHIPPASSNADDNWAYNPREKGGRYAIPIRMAQAGQIRLFQMAAYHADGSVFPVTFHVSFYFVHGTNVRSMPRIPAGESHPPYATGQHYPYVINAFEQYNADGTLKSTEIPSPVSTAGLWLAYGNDKVRAGYFPGDGSGVSPTVTGLLVDEAGHSFDTATYNQFDPRSPHGNLKNPYAGHLYMQLYCDTQGGEDVYFLGRFFRVEPGSAPGGS